MRDVLALDVPSVAFAPDAAERSPVTAPLARLFLLEAHRERPPQPWLDRTGRRLAVGLRAALVRPVPILRRRAASILAAAAAMRDLDDLALRAALAASATGARGGTVRDRRRTDAALVGSVAAVRRVTGLVPHPEQVMGALALSEGRIVEMATGEGKTLTIAIAAAVAAWRGRPCHVVTANDYLARRDAELFDAFFALCGLSVTAVTAETPIDSRTAAHDHDVVYTTAKELLGDFLRDRLAIGAQPSPVDVALRALDGDRATGARIVMRGLHQVFADEADSVLIDEAVTPLIISSQRPDGSLDAAARDAVRLAAALRDGVDYVRDLPLRRIELTTAGKARLASLAGGLSAFWQSPERAEELVSHALYARHLLVRDQHYIVREGKIVLLDELTGRLAEQRTLPVGLQQVLDATEGLEVSSPTEVSARLSFQRFFRLFPHVGGTTGTAQEARSELASVYQLGTVRIPTHRPVRRTHRGLRLLADEEAKLTAVAREALDVAATGRAVLVGIRTVRSGEALMRRFRALDPRRAAEVQLLHAVNHALEGAIVARAGRAGAITVATNMAGRGTDIALDASVRDKGGLHVVIGEPNDFRRIDRQLIGRCARQGDPGTVRMFVSFDDEVIRRFLPPALRLGWRRLHALWPGLAQRAAPALLAQAQRRAEALSRRQRRAILDEDLRLDKVGF